MKLEKFHNEERGISPLGDIVGIIPGFPRLAQKPVPEDHQ